MADTLNLVLPPQFVVNITHEMGNGAGFSVVAGIANTVVGGGGGSMTDAQVKTAYENNADTNEFDDAEQTKLAGIETAATADQTGAQIKTAYELEANTNAYTDAEKTALALIEPSATADQTGAQIKALYEAEAQTNAFVDAEKSKLAGIEASATADQTAAEIKTAYEGETNAFTDAQFTKLAGIEALADVSPTPLTNAQIKTQYEANTNTNVHTDAQVSKLAAIEASATADQTAAQIKAAYEGEASAFTDAQFTKLAGVESGATADQSDVEIETAYNAQVAKISGGEITAGTEVAVRRFSPDDVEAMIQVHGGGSGMTDAEVKTAYENNADTNEFDDAEQTKLAGIETAATADQTDAEIRTAVGAATDSNVFDDADVTKLGKLDELHYAPPLGTIAALVALTEASLTDKERRFVEAEIADYFYDSTASSGDEAPTDQTGGTGFWLKIVASGDTAASIKTKYESNADTNEYDDAEQAKLAAIEAGATADQTGAEIKTAYEAETNAFTDAKNTKLTGIETSATADQTNAEIRAAVAAATDSNVFQDADASKIDGIESGATADQTGAEIKTAYQAETNAYTDAKNTKLSGIETAATADQTNAEIRTAVEAATDSNVFNDADHSKLNAIEASATADQTDAEIETAYNAQVGQVSGAEMTAGTEVAVRRFSPDDVENMISIHGGGGGSTALNKYTANHTLVIGDAEDIIEMDVATANVLTIPLNSSVNFDVPVIITVGMLGVGITTITGVTGVKVNGVDAGSEIIDDQWLGASLYQRVVNEWVVQGAIGGGASGMTDAEVKIAYENNADTNEFSDAEQTKLAGIATAATIDQTGAAIKTLYEAETNAFTDAKNTKLTGIETAATADQTDAEIRTAVEAATDSNVFTNADHSKLDAVEASADVTDGSNVDAAGAIMDGDISAGEGFLRKTGSGAYEALKTNLGAAVAPSVTDDSASGYAVGSRWIDTTADKEYVCLNSGVGVAVWTETTAGAGGGETNTASNGGGQGVGVWDSKSGVDLVFRNLVATNAHLTITLDDANNEIDFDIPFATTTNRGVSELATVSEVDGGTETGRLVTPFNLAGSALQTKVDGVEALADVTDAGNVDTAGAIMDSDISAGEGLLRKTGSGAYVAMKTNLGATVAPGVSNDNTQGYAVGSQWIDVTADKEYVCLDISTGAAVWTETTGGGGGMSDAEVKTAYENNTNTNEFDDAEQTKLAGIATGATIDQTGAQIKTAYEAETNAFTDAKNTKLTGIDTGAKDDQTGAEIKTAYQGETNAFTDAQFTKLAGIDTAAKDDQTGAEIKTAYQSETNAFTDAQFTKLAGIATAATVDQTGAQIKTAYEAEANAFTDAKNTKLTGIDTGAKDDQTGAEIKTAYEGEANAYTDALNTKLGAIETLADVTDAANVTAAGATMQSGAGLIVGSTHFNTQTGTSYTLVAGDNGKTVTLNNASAIVLTVPTGLGIGFRVTLLQLGAGQVTVTASGTTLNSLSGNIKITGQHGIAGLLATAANVFALAGDLAA